VSFSNFGVDWAKSFPVFYVVEKFNWSYYTFSKCLSTCEAGFSSMSSLGINRNRCFVLWPYTFSKYLSTCEAGFSSMMTITQNIDIEWFSRMTLEYLFQPLFSESQILCVENRHKSRTEWLTGWNCFSFFNKRQIRTWLCISSSKRFAPWLSDMPVRMKLFSELQQPQRNTS